MDHIIKFKMLVLNGKPTAGTIFNKDNFSQSMKMIPFVTGEGSLNFDCGKCDHNILKSIRRGQVTKAVYKCPKCGTYNQIEN